MRTAQSSAIARLRRALADRAGTSAIEYALLAGMIAVVIVSAVTAVGANVLNNFYGPLAGALT